MRCESFYDALQRGHAVCRTMTAKNIEADDDVVEEDTENVDATDESVVEAEASLTSADMEALFNGNVESDPTAPLNDEEMLDIRVLTAELASQWETRESLRTSQPTTIGPNGEEIFAEDADEMAVRRFQRTDEQIAQMLLGNQGLIIRYLVDSFEGIE